MRGDGDGWVETPIGPRWGRYGAAGLLLYSVNNAGETVILLQHRATWVAQGDTWVLPGGARDSHETPTQAALREAWCASISKKPRPWLDLGTTRP